MPPTDGPGAGRSASAKAPAAGQAVAAGTIGGLASGAVASGTAKGALLGAFTGAVGSGILQSSLAGTWAGMAVNATASGITSELNGGRFGSGFLSAGLSAVLAPHMETGNSFQDGLSAAVMGGTISAMTGGKFANGAITATFSSAFGAMARNAAQNRAMDQRMATAAYGDPAYWMAWEPPSLPHGVVNFPAGMGDVASFGVSEYIRGQWSIDGGVDNTSSAYRNGMIAGIPAAAGTFLAGGVVANMGIRAAGGTATLYHFTSATSAAGITADGMINASAGMVGRGVYATAVPSSWWAFGASSTEVMIPISTTGLRVGAGVWPGTFRILGSVPFP